MKYVIRFIAWLIVWAAVSTICVLIALAVDPIEPAEGVEGEWAWQWWAGISIGLLVTLAIALIIAARNKRNSVENPGTDLRGGAKHGRRDTGDAPHRAGR